MAEFNLERRAEELFTPEARLYHFQMARQLAEKLAREALEAAAKECERVADSYTERSRTLSSPVGSAYIGAAAIIRGVAGTTEQPEAHCFPSGQRSREPIDHALVRVLSDAPPAPLSDADVLERAAEIMYARHFVGTGGQLCDQAAKLRAAEEPDIFEAFERAYDGPGDERLHTLARDWFGPLVSALERISRGTQNSGVAAEVADGAISALRERARAARGGGA